MILPKLCQIQPYVFGISMSITGLVMMGAGTLGVSRRHWDMAFGGAPFQYEWPGAAMLMMGMTGFFGVITIIGGGLDPPRRRFAAVRREARRRCGLRQADPIPAAPAAAASRQRSRCVAGHGHPGLALFVSFVLYYFVNWKYLSKSGC